MSGKQKAFTIVELLIVIVVIGILAAISLVAYTGINDRAKLSAAKSHAAQLSRSPDTLDTLGNWKFDECSGSVISDSSSAKNNGTVAGTASWSTDTPSGSGCSFQFNGSTLINVSGRITANYYLKATWLKITSCGVNNNMVSSGNDNSNAFFAPNCRLSAGHNGSWTSVSDSVSLADGKWHYVVLEYTASSPTVGTLKLWRDGSLVATNTGVAPPNNPAASTIQIGGFNGGNNFTGLLDEVLVITK
jgi:prepilin-type N-terminal cleavage/methylation domain-containing protein